MKPTRVLRFLPCGLTLLILLSDGSAGTRRVPQTRLELPQYPAWLIRESRDKRALEGPMKVQVVTFDKTNESQISTFRRESSVFDSAGRIIEWRRYGREDGHTNWTAIAEVSTIYNDSDLIAQARTVERHLPGEDILRAFDFEFEYVNSRVQCVRFPYSDESGREGVVTTTYRYDSSGFFSSAISLFHTTEGDSERVVEYTQEILDSVRVRTKTAYRKGGEIILDRLRTEERFDAEGNRTHKTEFLWNNDTWRSAARRAFAEFSPWGPNRETLGIWRDGEWTDTALVARTRDPQTGKLREEITRTRSGHTWVEISKRVFTADLKNTAFPESTYVYEWHSQNQWECIGVTVAYKGDYEDPVGVRTKPLRSTGRVAEKNSVQLVRGSLLILASEARDLVASDMLGRRIPMERPVRLGPNRHVVGLSGVTSVPLLIAVTGDSGRKTVYRIVPEQ